MASGEEVDPSLVSEFVSITGAPESKARALLIACNGNLEMAVGVYLEEGNEEAQSSGTDLQNTEEDNVRAPIPQTRGVLVEGPYRANRPRRHGNQSVFDAFRDFQAEAREQEQVLSGQVCGTSKRKTLQELFKPPLDIMHKGTFDTAKMAGEQDGKWLMVNIQDSKEFNCQKLNRDVWSNESVRTIVTKHFILWQVYHDSDDGDRYSQFYHVDKCPHLAVLDPRTGEKMVEWDGVDAKTFCENATDFLLRHSLGKNTNCLSPPTKRRKRESIIDASEDSQLEAAIAASLKETNSGLVKQNDHEDDSLTEFTDSESECENIPKTSEQGKNDVFEENGTVSESEKEPPSNDINENKTNTTNDIVEDSKQECLVKSENSKEEDSRLESDDDEIDSSDGSGKAFLMLRFPNGERKQKLFSADAKILDLVKYVQAKGFSNERYELVTNFPRKKLSYMDMELSLKDAGLFPRETVFIQER